QTKSDTYELTFKDAPKGITAIRVEALPDDRLPRHGPGRVYYEGPIGSFTLCDIAAFVGDKKKPFTKASHSYASGKFTAAVAIDNALQTGWAIDGGQGRAHAAVFSFAEPLADGTFTLKMLFERHFSAGLGKFRIAVTTDAQTPVARDWPHEVE